MTRARHPVQVPDSNPGTPAATTPTGRRRRPRAYDPRSIAAPGQGLGDLHPALYAQALRCPQYPELPLVRLSCQSNLSVVWRCQCGNETERKVNNVVNRGRVLCDRCQASGKSRFEFEVAELLRVGLDTEVHTHHGARRRDRVDLYLPAFETAVELDPYRTHRDRVEVDRRRLDEHRARYPRVFRVRDERLPTLEGCPSVARTGPVLRWAHAIAQVVAPSQWRDPSPGEIRIATEAGAAAFFALIQTPPSPCLADCPEVAAELVENLDVPGQQAQWISLGSGSLCLWSCSRGHPDYSAPVDRRTGPQATGCPQCGRARGAEMRRRPDPGGSAGEVCPEIVGFFIDNLTRPDVGLADLRPGSHDLCRWRCAHPGCVTLIRDSVKGRSVRPGAGCYDHRGTRIWEARRANPTDPSNLRWQAGLRALDDYIAVHGHAQIPVASVAPDGFDLGAWVGLTRKRRADLRADQLDDLAERPAWVWGAKQAAWDSSFALLAQFAAREGHTHIPSGHREDGRRLDTFVHKQRRRYRDDLLPPDRVEALEELPGWVWRERRRRSGATRTT